MVGPYSIQPEAPARTPAQPRPRAVVVGSTFGAHYARALSRPDSPVELVGVVGAGSARSQALADECGVRLYALQDAPEAHVACVVVRSGISGGPGDDIARHFLCKGVAVLQEHPVHPQSAEDLLRVARDSAFYAVNSFYVHLPTVQNFLRAVETLRQQGSPVTGVEVRGSLHIFYPILDILAAMLPGLPELMLQQQQPSPAAENYTHPGGAPRHIPLVQSQAHPGVSQVSLDWAGVPVDIRLYNRIAPLDPDNHAQPLFGCVVETPDGELSLDHVHGPTRWSPRSHYVDGQLSTSDHHLASQIVGEVGAGTESEYSGREILGKLWPAGIQRRVHQVATAERQTAVLGQRDLAVVHLWQELSALLPASMAVDSVPPRIIDWK